MTSYLIPRDNDFSFPDYESIFSRLTSAIGSVLSRWSNFVRASFENVLLGNQAFNFDVLMGYIEQRIRETRLATLVHRANAVRLAVLHHNYRPDETTAAQVIETINISEITAGTVTFPAGTVIYTTGSNRISGQLLAQVQITPGNLTVDGTWEHSETVSDSFTGNGKPMQRVPLERAPYIWGSMTISGWTEVEHIADYGASDQVFKMEVDQNGYGDIVFGNGTYGAMPSSLINYSYKIGGGEDGNVAAGSLERIAGSFQDSLGNPVTVSCTNAADATGGGPKESVELIKLKAPAAGKAQERSVGRPDQETHAELVASVARALVLTIEQRAGIEENTGHVYAVGYGTMTNSGRYRPVAVTAADQALIVTNLTATYPVCNTFDIMTMDTVFNEVSFQISISVADGYTFAEVAQAIYDALDDFFAVALSDADGRAPNTDMGFGEDLDGKLRWHVLFNIVRDVAGIKGINEDTFIPVNEVILETYEWPKLGTVRVTDADTGSYEDF